MTAAGRADGLRVVSAGEFPAAVSPTPTDDLLAVYGQCLRIEALCLTRRLSGLSAIQVGLPWVLSVCCLQPGRWRYFMNYSYSPLSPEKKPCLVRFVNVESAGCRYFLVQRHAAVQYHAEELVLNPQPALVTLSGTDNTIGQFIQNECDLLVGKFPHLEGQEYWLRV